MRRFILAILLSSPLMAETFVQTVPPRSLDSDSSHSLFWKSGSNLTADREFTLLTGDANRTLTLSANVSLNQSLLTTSYPAFFGSTLNTDGTHQAVFTIDNTGATDYGINGEHFAFHYYGVNDRSVLHGPGTYIDGRGSIFSINGIYGTAHHAGTEAAGDYRLIPPFWNAGGTVDVGDWSAAMIGCSTDTRKGLTIEAAPTTTAGSVALALGYNDPGTDTSHVTFAIGPDGSMGWGDIVPTSTNDLKLVYDSGTPANSLYSIRLRKSSLGLALDGTLDVSSTATLADTTIADTKKLTFAGAQVAASYANSGGSGNRAGIVTVTSSSFPDGSSGQNPRSQLVNGNTADTGYWWQGTATVGGYLQFDFGSGASKIITEAKFYQSSGTSHHTAKWQGSNDGSSFADIGGSFVVGNGLATQTMTSLSANTTGYRYYRLTTVSGSVSASPWIFEFEFKITDAGVTDSYIDQSAGTIRFYQNSANVASVSSTGVTSTGFFSSGLATSISAAGSSNSDATAITKSINIVTTTGSGQGVIISPVTPTGAIVTVANKGANSLKVYPPASYQIDSLTTTTGGYSITTLTTVRFVFDGTQYWSLD